jgi:hypothetical protein
MQNDEKQPAVASPIEPVVMWLVEAGIDYEGSWPIGIYSTLGKAERAKERNKTQGDYVNILEILTDEDLDT